MNSEPTPRYNANAWSAHQGRNWALHDADLEMVHGVISDIILRHARPVSGEVIYDIGCGGGALSAACAALVDTGSVTGVDVSPALVDLARGRYGDAAQFVLGDAQIHDFAPGAADLMVSRFGVMFFENPVAAFANMRRALRPGGRLVAACWAGMPNNPWFRDPVLAMESQIGPGPRPDPKAPGPMSLADGDFAGDILRKAGFADVTITTEDCAMRHPHGARAAAELILAVGPIRAMVADRLGTDADVTAIADGLTQRFAAYSDGAAVAIPARVHILSATSPD